MKKYIVLTVSQGKRLIARAVARHPWVVSALENGILALGKGTTNAYIAEELLGRGIDKGSYTFGHTLPSDKRGLSGKRQKIDEMVWVRGQVEPGLTVAEGVSRMGPGDVFIKGANALNWAKRVAGVLVGESRGGTTGYNLPTVMARKARFIIPVGLEKEIPEDILELHRWSADPEYDGPSLFPITGEIITEIEAFEILFGIKARCVGGGGICGAEGSTHLVLEADGDLMPRVLAFVDEMHSEPQLMIGES